MNRHGNKCNSESDALNNCSEFRTRRRRDSTAGPPLMRTICPNVLWHILPEWLTGCLAPPSGHCVSTLRKTVRAFDRPPAGLRDPHAGNRDLPPAHPHGLAMRRGKAVLDQVGYHIDVEPMADQRRPGAAAQSCVGEHFERAPLLSAEMNPRHTNAPQRQKVLADRICHLPVCANRAASIRNNTLKINQACDFHAAPHIKRGLARIRRSVAVASPARTRPARRSNVKPCAMICWSVHPL